MASKPIIVSMRLQALMFYSESLKRCIGLS